MSKNTKPNALLHVRDCPSWQQDQFILKGYRPLSNSYPISVRSLLYVHNQTVNIYTHLLGFLLFVLTAFAFRDSITSRYHTASYEDIVVFSSFFAGVLTCLGLSSAFHSFSNHSEEAYHQWLVLDFLGILCLIAGSWVPGVYYGFYCQRTVSKFYLIMVSSTLHT